MPRHRLILLFVCLAALVGGQSPAPGAATGPAPLPTAAEVRQQVREGQYRPALQSLLRILELKGAAAAPYDRTEMLLLRAECQLQIRETQAAKNTLDAVLKEARGGNGIPPKPDALGQALALAALVAKSPNMLYTPRTRTGPLAPKPINILDRDARSGAFKALFEDSLAEVKARVHAQGAGTLTSLLDTAKALATLRALEKAGTNDDAQSKPLAVEFTTIAALLLNNTLAGMNGTVDSIAAGANLLYALPIQRVDRVTGLRSVVQVPRRRGLVSDEPARLKAIQQSCSDIITASYDLHLALNAPDPFAAIAGDANLLAQKAAKVLADDYTRATP